MPPTIHGTLTRSLLSRSRVDWAIEAARRRVGGAEPAGALGEAGLRGSAGAPTDASSKLRRAAKVTAEVEEGACDGILKLKKMVLQRRAA